MIFLFPIKTLLILIFGITGFAILANAGLIPLALALFAGYVIYDNIRHRTGGGK